MSSNDCETKTNKNRYDELKEYGGRIYSGMRIGSSHSWNYPNGKWLETKVSPDKWEFSFESIKQRNRPARPQSGAAKGTTYHWYIVADQRATKLDEDTYHTVMTGLKFKIGHKRPYWRTFSYDYADQLSYKERVIKALKETLEFLENE